MSEFDIRTLFEKPSEGPNKKTVGFSSPSEALKNLKKIQIQDIIGPNRPLYQVIESIGGEVILKYREEGNRIIDGSLSYSIPRGKIGDLLQFLGQDNLPPLGKCLIIADFGSDLDISVYERSENDGKTLVCLQGRHENIFFVSKNFPNGFRL